MPLYKIHYTFIIIAGLVFGFSAPLFAAVSFRSAESATATIVAGSGGTIIHEGAGNRARRTSCGDINPSIPASSNTINPEDDILIAVIVARENGASVSAPTGWNEYFSDSYPGEEFQTFIFWRFYGTSAPGTIFSQSGNCNSFMGQISRFSGVDTTTPFDPNVNPITPTGQWSRQNSGNLNVSTAAATTTQANSMLIVASTVADNRRVSQGGTWNQSFDSTTSQGRDSAISLNYQLQTTAGLKQISNWNWDLQAGGNDPNYAAIFALRPAPAAGTPTLTINKPAGTISGDVMIASVSTRPDITTVTAPVNWTLLRTTTQANSNSSVLKTYYKVAGASEPSSYNWTFSSSNFNSAVGGIASFIGVDTTTPIDADTGSATSSSTSHTAPTVTTTLDDGMLVTVHEYTSSRAWTPPAGMTEMVDVSSLTPNNAVGISMEMNYELRPTAGATGTRTATVGGDADSGATHSISLKPTVPLTCFTDSFNRANGTPGSDWVVSNNNGTFGNPVILNNRLRLTDSSGNAATMATLQQIFPGAGNRIEVEFDHYAYGGSGADGIAVILSDFSVSPAPGGYGGSLGYAQRTGINGFNGGWLGVGIDEYGNFSNPTEGRIGGPGFRRDSVSIRGSGSGTSGYVYHAGTAANLVPEVDNNGAASPPHRYRIIIDHSNGINAWVSVERDTTGSGSNYVTLVAPYDAKAQAGQAAVPTNWILSYTGSTGGATNVHEIDNLSVCATAQSSVSGPDHFAINYASGANGTGVNCQAEGITIEAHDASHSINTTYTGTVTLNTSTANGDWSKTGTASDALGTLSPGASDSGNATYTFIASDNGSITLNFKNTHTETTDINITAGSLSETSNSASAADDYQIAFASTGFNFLAGAVKNTIATQISGKPSDEAPGIQSLELQAIKTSDETGACEAAFTGATAVEIAIECIDPTSCTGNNLYISTDTVTTPTPFTQIVGSPELTYTAIADFNFGNATDTTAPFIIRYDDAGKIKLHARKVLTPSTEQMTGASNEFVVRPFGFSLDFSGQRTADYADNGLLDNSTGTNLSYAANASGSIFTQAGVDFTSTLTAVLWQATDDTDDDGIADTGANLTNNAATQNFGNEVTPVTPTNVTTSHAVTLVTNTGALTNNANSASFNNGVGTKTYNWSEVGIFNLTTTLTNYLASGSNITGTAQNVGRFTPHHFDTSITDGCTNVAPLTSFTYSGQPITVQAKAMNNLSTPTITNNYSGSFAHNVTLSSTTAIPGSFGTTNTILATDFFNGSYIKTGVTYTFSNKKSGPDAAFTIRATDTTDSVSSNDPAANEGSTNMRSGRVRLENTFGPELTPLVLPLNIEYYSSGDFILNTDDTCTTYDATAGTLTNYTGNLSPGDTTVTGAVAGTPGLADITFSAPGAGNEGSVTLLTNNISSWLTYNWNVDCDDADGDGDITTGIDAGALGQCGLFAPFGTASFGLYRGDDRIIYQREVF